MAEIDSESFEDSLKDEIWNGGAFGIPEPPPSAKTVPNSNVDAWLVPALAFDEKGNRLGRGGGFYDRFLEESSGLRIGVGYDCVILHELPCDDWDQRMDLIVTERRLLWICGRK
jgi:5-formyltetrahydrofolate cyclo-ligase